MIASTEVILTNPSDNNKILLTSACMKNATSIQEIFIQRSRVYTKYGYLAAGSTADGIESDAFDKAGDCTYFGVTREDGRLIGSVRLIRSLKFPMESFFTYDLPASLTHIPHDKTAEMSRLVVERTEADHMIPRNLILLMLSKSLLDTAREEGIDVGYAFLKRRLVKKLRLLNIPFEHLEPFTCIYPADGPMAPYFYAEPEDGAVPSYFIVQEVEKYIDDVFNNSHIFEHQSPTAYALKHSAFNTFLHLLGIM